MNKSANRYQQLRTEAQDSASVQCTFIKPSQIVTKLASFRLFHAETGKA